MEVTDANTGEIREVENLGAAAAEMIERPPYWRRAKQNPAFYIEGDWGSEFEKAFLEVQKEIGPVIQTDSSNDFNKSRYASLKIMLTKVQPILNKYGISMRQGTGKINTRNDLGGPKAFLPVWLHLTHVDTLQWQCVVIEMPITKFDAQSQKAAFTFGRRCDIEGYFSLAPTDEDDSDGVQASHQLTEAQLDEIMDRMAGKLAECKTEAELQKWRKEHEQGLSTLDDGRVNQLKAVWQKRLNELKPKNSGSKKESVARRDAE